MPGTTEWTATPSGSDGRYTIDIGTEKFFLGELVDKAEIWCPEDFGDAMMKGAIFSRKERTRMGKNKLNLPARKGRFK